MPDPTNPMRAAMDARDAEVLQASLADGVVLNSPIFSVPFDGPDEVADVLSTVYEVAGPVEYLYDVPGDPHVFVWRSDVDGEPIEGTDMFRLDGEGRITEITIFLRPLRGIAAFLDAAGPKMGAKRSKSRGILMKALGPPPSAMMRMVAAIGPRMLRLRRAKD